MPTESPDNINGTDEPADGTARFPFNPEKARAASLHSTLAHVRRRRRMRRMADAGTAALIIGTAVWQAFRHRQPDSLSTPGPGITATLPPPEPQPPTPESVIFSTPLNAAVERIVPVSTPDLRIRSQASPDLMVRTSPDSGSLITRLGNDEFHQMLARNGVYLIRIGNQWPRVLPCPPSP